MSPPGIPISCIAVSGSLRRASSNTLLLESAASLAPGGVVIHVDRSIGELPHFNPDLDPLESSVVRTWIDSVREAHGFIVSTPEYAHGLPGSLKNGLDWLVGSDAFVNKPFMLLNATSRSTHAQESLIDILTTMSGVHIKEASTTIPLLGKSPDECKRLIREQYAGQIQGALGVFQNTVRHQL